MSRVRVVAVAAACYALVVLVAPPVLLRALTVPNRWLAAAALVAYLVVVTAVIAFGSRWICARVGERDVLLPLLAWWLGSIVGTTLLSLFITHTTPSGLLDALAFPATFGLLTSPAAGPVPGFTVGFGQHRFGFGIPWTFIVINAAVFWRPRKRIHGMPNNGIQTDSPSGCR